MRTWSIGTLIAGLVVVWSFACGCQKKSESPATPAAESNTPASGLEQAAPAQPGATVQAAETSPASGPADRGKLEVKAVKDFLKFEVKSEDGQVVAKGDTNITTPELPAGLYTVEVKPDEYPVVRLDPVSVAVGQTAVVQMTGFGLIKVKGSKDFIKFTVLGTDGTQVASGDTNITTVLLPVGEYTFQAGDKTGNKLKVSDGAKIDFDSGF